MSSQQPPVPPTQSGKLPIPRLNRPLDRPKKPPKKSDVLRQGRVARACLSCRARKVKCNGAQPRCQNCVDDSVPCVYPASRKDRLKTLVMSLSCSFLPMLMLSARLSTTRTCYICSKNYGLGLHSKTSRRLTT